ncbi:MAG: hypothetical protein GY774_35630 [Planctomycetes bacterium]|nr:hypothetical protein [Planctomycetota bacterium]
MPRASNDAKTQQRNAAIVNDYLAGLNYKQLAKKYKLSNNTIFPVLNDKQVLKLREQEFRKRCTLLPLASEIELDLLLTGKEETKLKIIHKLQDDIGIGSSRTSHSVAINIFNQTVNQISTFMLDIVDTYGQEAMKKAAGQVIDTEYTADNVNSKDTD